jgi:hypothetical protein
LLGLGRAGQVNSSTKISIIYAADSLYKVDMPNSMFDLKWTFDWSYVQLGVSEFKNKHQKDTCRKESGLCAQKFVNHSRRNKPNVMGRTYGILRSFNKVEKFSL